MKIELWRDKLKTWVDTKMKVSSHALSEPTNEGVWSCFIPALSNIDLTQGNQVNAVAIQDIFLSIRYPSNIPYSKLPLDKIEAIISDLIFRLVIHYKEIADLTSLNNVPLENPIKVAEYGDGEGDWLIGLQIRIAIAWVAELGYVLPSDEGQPIPDYGQPIAAKAGLYTTSLTSKERADFIDDRKRRYIGRVYSEL